MAEEGVDERAESPGTSSCHHLGFWTEHTKNTGSEKTDLTAPREIAFYSFDEEHKYRPDDSSISYYWPMKVDENARSIGLQTGFETFKQVDESIDGHLDALLQALQEKEVETGRITDTEVITWRGQLTKILTAIYNKRDSFEMNVTKLQGQIFLEEHHQARLERSSDSMPFGKQSPMGYLGYKFETLSTIPDIWDNVRREDIENRHEQQVSNHSQYCSIVSTTLDDKHKLVYGGEVDCIWDSHDMLHKCNPSEYHGEYGNSPNYFYHDWVELKTLSKSMADKKNYSYDMRLLKFWAQSYLINCPRIILGLRTDKRGTLDIPKIEELKTHAIPKDKSWSKNRALRFLSAFIQLLKDHVTEGDYWRVRHFSDQEVIQLLLIKRGTYGSIISEKFLEWRSNFDENGILKPPGVRTGDEQAPEAMQDAQPLI